MVPRQAEIGSDGSNARCHHNRAPPSSTAGRWDDDGGARRLAVGRLRRSSESLAPVRALRDLLRETAVRDAAGGDGFRGGDGTLQGGVARGGGIGDGGGGAALYRGNGGDHAGGCGQRPPGGGGAGTDAVDRGDGHRGGRRHGEDLDG